MGRRVRGRRTRVRLMPLDCRPIPAVLDPNPIFGSNLWWMRQAAAVGSAASCAMKVVASAGGAGV
jgi:hypothetical protein